MGKGSKNFDPPTIVDEENSSTSTTTKGQDYTWEDIRQHSTKTDRWLVINKRVYDVTRWLKHPGGQSVLNHYAGQDATEAFQSLHPEINRVQKYLKPFYIGDLKETVHEDDDDELKNDFEQLRQKAIARVRSFDRCFVFSSKLCFSLEIISTESMVFSSHLSSYLSI